MPKQVKPAVIDTLDFSALSMYLRCGEQFQRRYVLGQKDAPSIAMVDGTSYHAALADANAFQKKKGQIWKPQVMVDSYIGHLRKETTKPENKKMNWLDEDENSLHKKAKVLFPEYANKFAPKIEPEWVEQPVIHPVEIEGVKFKLAGVIDLTTKKSKRNNPFANRLIDYKTSSRPKTQSTADESLQLTIYHLVTKMPRVGFLTFVKSANPYIAPVFADRCPADVAWAMQIAKRAFNAIQLGVFNLTDPDPRNWWCSEKFCGFWKDCRGKFVAMRGK